ncbi:RL1 [Enterospora canceri]|uniref:RL1 n=1 Tax=Enterospora canceri TaxID=1081671 RepID=A0A1Y1S9Y5_9MICR|nr:RL1 [Enterospora canceri]
MATKIDEKMKVVSFLTEDVLKPAVEQIKATASEEKPESYQIQISTKGYENRKDPKMTKEIKFPFHMRLNPGSCAIGDAKAKEIADANGIPCVLIQEYEGKSEESKKKREKFLKNYTYFILCPGYNKAFSLKEILMKKKTHFMCNAVEQLPAVYEACRFTYKVKVKDWFSISFPVGHTQMPDTEVVENIKYGVQFLADNLKKGPMNIKDCYLKRTTGGKVKLY